MSEPLSRAALDDALSSSAKGIHDLAATALHYLDRVAELEKERDGWERQEGEAWTRYNDSENDRLRAEAGLAAAQEALKEDPRRWSFWTLVTIAHWLLEAEYPRDVFVSDGTTGDPGPRFLGYLRRALAELPDGTLDDVLARGGGQQEHQ